MIVAGFGFRAGVGTDSLRDALDRAATGARPQALATLTDKAPTLAPLARDLDLPLLHVTPDEAQAQQTLTRSAASDAARGTGSVAEACALAAAGPGARLLGPRIVSADRRATCALAERSPE